MVNSLLNRCFEDGKIKEALLGENSTFYIYDRVGGEHDLGYVISQLFLWADNMCKAKRAVEGILDAVEHVEDDLEMALSIFISYYTQRKYRADFLLSEDRDIKETLKKMIRKNSQKIAFDDEPGGRLIVDKRYGKSVYTTNLRNSVDHLSRYVPCIYDF